MYELDAVLLEDKIDRHRHVSRSCKVHRQVVNQCSYNVCQKVTAREASYTRRCPRSRTRATFAKGTTAYKALDALESGSRNHDIAHYMQYMGLARYSCKQASAHVDCQRLAGIIKRIVSREGASKTSKAFAFTFLVSSACLAIAHAAATAARRFAAVLHRPAPLAHSFRLHVFDAGPVLLLVRWTHAVLGLQQV